MNEPIRLFAAGGTVSLALTLGQGLPTEIAGKPCVYHWRQSLRLGDYTHPGTGRKFTITPERIERLMGNFHRMQQAGRKVYVPVNHSEKTEDNRGYVVDVRRNGEWLEELHQYIGEDAALDAARSQVSLNIVPNLKDGNGNVYDEAIEHSSLVVNPVVTGQCLPAIAASEGQPAAGETYVLAEKGVNEMTFTLPDAQVARLKELLGGDELTPENLTDRVSGKIAATATDTTTALSATHQTALGQKDQEIQTLRLSAAPTLDGFALSAMVTASERAKNHAIAAGAISPAVADKLYKRLVKPAEDKLNKLALSASGDNGNVPMALGVFEDLAENKPLKLGETTPVQVLERKIPGDQPSQQQELDQLAQEVRGHLGVKAK